MEQLGDPQSTSLAGSRKASPPTAADKLMCVEWLEHGKTMASGMLSCLEDSFMVDTTLKYGSERHRVHRLVLSVFLPAFKQLTEVRMESLAENDEDIETLIRFMYTGKLTVVQSKLDQLARLADVLNFYGLKKAIQELKLHTTVSTTDRPEKVIAQKDNSNKEITQKDDSNNGIVQKDDFNKGMANPQFSETELEEDPEGELLDEFVNDTVEPESSPFSCTARINRSPLANLTMMPRCDKCKQSFVSLTNLARHSCPNSFARFPLSLKIFQCFEKNCTYLATTDKDLRQHSKDVHLISMDQHTGTNRIRMSFLHADHPPSSPGHICKTCGRRYANSSGLSRHMNSHYRARYSCDKCGHACTTKEYLEFHLSYIHNQS